MRSDLLFSMPAAAERWLASEEGQARAQSVKAVWENPDDAKAMMQNYWYTIEPRHRARVDYEFDKLLAGSRDFWFYHFYLRRQMIEAKTMDLHIAEYRARFGNDEWVEWMQI